MPTPPNHPQPSPKHAFGSEGAPGGPGGVRTPLTQSVSREGPGTPTAALALRTPGDHPPIESLYIHVPFCTHKCHYCDFYSFVDTRDQQAAFVDRLVDELGELAPHAGPLRTIFVGGGTPSLLRIDLWERVLGVLRSRFDLSAFGERAGNPGEFTVECNPETTTRELLELLKAGGVNRVSVGAQSFDPAHLRTLERRHDPENVQRAIELARLAGIGRQSIDLIFAIPGQTIEDWRRDVERGLALGTTHISCYNLTYEPNTAMTARKNAGEFTPTGEETEREMYALTVDLCARSGLSRYEVSNFARPGDESRHNLAYWLQHQWLAAGPSAGAHVFADRQSLRAGSWRYKNAPRLGDYLASRGYAPVVDLESPDPARLIRERIMMGLRLARGLDPSNIVNDAEHVQRGMGDALLLAAERLRGEGLLVPDGQCWRLTDEGFMVGDSVAAELMNAARKVTRPTRP